MGNIFIILPIPYQNGNKMITSLIGTYDCKADDKGRLMIAAQLKKQLATVLQDGFVLKRSVFKPCLELYPRNEWEKTIQSVDQLSRFTSDNNSFIRLLNYGVRLIEIDNSGRVLIPKDLMLQVGIDKEVVLSSAINMIEIWDKTKYEETIQNELADFAKLAEKVMGNTNGAHGNNIP